MLHAPRHRHYTLHSLKDDVAYTHTNAMLGMDIRIQDFGTNPRQHLDLIQLLHPSSARRKHDGVVANAIRASERERLSEKTFLIEAHHVIRIDYVSLAAKGHQSHSGQAKLKPTCEHVNNGRGYGVPGSRESGVAQKGEHALKPIASKKKIHHFLDGMNRIKAFARKM